MGEETMADNKHRQANGPLWMILDLDNFSQDASDGNSTCYRHSTTTASHHRIHDYTIPNPNILSSISVGNNVND